MTRPEPLVGTAVRRANLVDVPAVVRLFAPTAAALRLPPVEVAGEGRGQDGPGVDWEQAQSAMRLMMAHHALEDGQVWVVERPDGTFLAAGVWLPPDDGTEAAHSRLGSLLSRELATDSPELPEPPEALQAAYPDEPHWKCVLVFAPDDAGTWDLGLATRLLTPGLHTVDEDGVTAVAITRSADRLAPLQPLGFAGPHEVPLAPDSCVWLATRAPKGRPATAHNA
ncbi:hypothetical protein [Streptacidiphilus carbonis]|uniref:hypothetical protein n=1 Tax=Streptacidiphilus carbonis TaxID=105422 RepID=UPI0005AA23AE|nr:hypothetical protein [Streptacidiphilus carbonis]